MSGKWPSIATCWSSFAIAFKTSIKNGATLEKVKAARVTADYDDRFGANSGPWTTDMFVEAVYTSLKNSAANAAIQDWVIESLRIMRFYH